MQLELFPSLYPPRWVCSICGKDTSKIEYDYIGSGYNHLGCELKIELEDRSREEKIHDLFEKLDKTKISVNSGYYTGDDVCEHGNSRSSNCSDCDEYENIHPDIDESDKDIKVDWSE
jgi:predicted transcriptional regulator